MTTEFLAIQGLVGLARRAGQLVWGMDATCRSIQRGESSLVILALDLSDHSRSKIERQVEIAGLPCICAGTCEAIGRIVGKARCGILSVSSADFARGILQKWTAKTDRAM